MENYSQVFSLIENDNNENFSKSNVWIKCESSYLRIVSLFGIQEAGENIESYTSKINKLKTNNLSSFELSRLDNMLLVVLIKSRKFKSAIEFLKSRNVNTENCSEFDIYTELLCYYFVLKSGEILEKACLDRIHNIEQLLSSDCSINKNKHPIESIYLILALISWHQKNVKDARSYITKAKKSFCLKSSNVSITIFKCITIAESIIFSNDSLLKKDKLNKDELNKYIDLIIGI